MKLDIHTLSIVLSLTALLQIIIISLQYFLNRTYRGIGWWLAGYTMIAAGFGFIPLREIQSIEKLSIITANILHISGSMAVFIGTTVFLNRRIKRLVQVTVLFLPIYVLLISYFLFMENSLRFRIIIYSISMGLISFAVSYTLFRFKSRAITVSANFISIVFFLMGTLFSLRVAVTILEPAWYDFFTPTFMQVMTFLVSFININLCMSGFILLINQSLNEENTAAREHFEMIFNASPDAALISRLDNGYITNVNESFLVLSGMTKTGVIGKLTSDAGFWVTPSDRDKIREELLSKGICENLEVAFKSTDGKILSGLVSSKVIYLNGIPHVISVVRDNTVRKKIEDKLIMAIDEAIKQRESAQKANREKEILLREVHHRIKNNMSTIIGLLSIQADTVKEPSASAALHDAGSRVRSMMMLYDKLYRSEGFTEISIKEYLSPLVDETTGSFADGRNIRIIKSIDEFQVNAEKLFSLGIIVNELITNTMKYAFKSTMDRSIIVTASNSGNRAHVTIGDNGIGLPESVNIDNSTGFGLQLVGMLTKQLGGEISIERTGGTKYILQFNL